MLAEVAGKWSVDFAMGAHGLEFDGVEVTRATMQAYSLGVRAGWKISTINGEEVTSSADVRRQLNMAKVHRKKYEIVFIKDPATIRAEQDKEEAKAELARLATTKDPDKLINGVKQARKQGISMFQIERITLQSVADMDVAVLRAFLATPGMTGEARAALDASTELHEEMMAHEWSADTLEAIVTKLQKAGNVATQVGLQKFLAWGNSCIKLGRSNNSERLQMALDSARELGVPQLWKEKVLCGNVAKMNSSALGLLLVSSSTGSKVLEAVRGHIKNLDPKALSHLLQESGSNIPDEILVDAVHIEKAVVGNICDTSDQSLILLLKSPHASPMGKEIAECVMDLNAALKAGSMASLVNAVMTLERKKVEYGELHSVDPVFAGLAKLISNGWKKIASQAVTLGSLEELVRSLRELTQSAGPAELPVQEVVNERRFDALTVLSGERSLELVEQSRAVLQALRGGSDDVEFTFQTLAQSARFCIRIDAPLTGIAASEEEICQDIAKAISKDAALRLDSLHVIGLREGSIVVEVEMLGPDAIESISKVQQKLSDPKSAAMKVLRDSKLGSAAKNATIKMITPWDYHHTEDGNTALHDAMARGCVEQMEQILASNVTELTSKVNARGFTAFQLALHCYRPAEEDADKRVEMLRRYLDIVGPQTAKKLVYQADCEGWTPLLLVDPKGPVADEEEALFSGDVTVKDDEISKILDAMSVIKMREMLEQLHKNLGLSVPGTPAKENSKAKAPPPTMTLEVADALWAPLRVLEWAIKDVRVFENGEIRFKRVPGGQSEVRLLKIWRALDKLVSTASNSLDEDHAAANVLAHALLKVTRGPMALTAESNVKGKLLIFDCRWPYRAVYNSTIQKIQARIADALIREWSKLHGMPGGEWLCDTFVEKFHEGLQFSRFSDLIQTKLVRMDSEVKSRVGETQNGLKNPKWVDYLDILDAQKAIDNIPEMERRRAKCSHAGEAKLGKTKALFCRIHALWLRQYCQNSYPKAKPIILDLVDSICGEGNYRVFFQEPAKALPHIFDKMDDDLNNVFKRIRPDDLQSTELQSELSTVANNILDYCVAECVVKDPEMVRKVFDFLQRPDMQRKYGFVLLWVRNGFHKSHNSSKQVRTTGLRDVKAWLQIWGTRSEDKSSVIVEVQIHLESFFKEKAYMEIPCEVSQGRFDWDSGAWNAVSEQRLMTARSLKPVDDFAAEIDLAKALGASGSCIQDADISLCGLKLGEAVAVNDKEALQKAIDDAKKLGLNAERVVKISMDEMPAADESVVVNCLSTLAEAVGSAFGERANAAVEEVDKVAGVIEELKAIEVSGDWLMMHDEMRNPESKSSVLAKKYRVIRNVRTSEGHKKIKSFIEDCTAQLEECLFLGCQERIGRWKGWGLIDKINTGSGKNPFMPPGCGEKLEALDSAHTIEEVQAILMDFPMPNQLPPSKDPRMDSTKLLADLSSSLHDLEAALKILVDAKQACDMNSLELLINATVQVDVMPEELLQNWLLMKNKDKKSEADDKADEKRVKEEAERQEKARALGGACMDMRDGKLLTTIGILEGGVFRPVILKGTTLPVQHVLKNLTNGAAQQKLLKLQVYQTEEDSHSEFLAEVEIEIRPGKKQTASVNATFEVNNIGIFTVAAINNKTKKQTKTKMKVFEDF